MQTSNFATFRGSCDPNLVSIPLRFPRGWGGRRYKALAPRREMLTMDEASYREGYQKILDGLDPQKVFEDLMADAILLCWEAPGKFCHRRLVAAWLEEKSGVQVPELPQGYHHNQRNLFV